MDAAKAEGEKEMQEALSGVEKEMAALKAAAKKKEAAAVDAVIANLM